MCNYQLPVYFKSLYFVSSFHPVGQLKQAAEAAATFIAMEPSDEVMANNIRYYTSTFKVEADAFVPRQVSPYDRLPMHRSHLGTYKIFTNQVSQLKRKTQGVSVSDPHIRRCVEWRKDLFVCTRMFVIPYVLG